MCKHIETGAGVTLETLVLRNTSIDDNGIKKLSNSLVKSKDADLKMLNLNCNEITSEGVKDVMEIVKNKPNLEILL